MSLKFKIWLILGCVMTGLSALGGILDYREVEQAALSQMRQQALDLRAALMATRRGYHRQFLASGLPLNEQTLGFLPAHAMTRIAQDYPNWTKSGVRFNNVSDRPRNLANQADADDFAAMAWFRANPKADVYTRTLRGSDGRFLGRRGANHDITERKRAEELERFSAFQAGIAEMSTLVLHNIGNAITAVSQDAENIAHAGAELLHVASLLDAAAGEQLFRFGFSTKQRGAGFGLHSVAVYAQECGGRVSLRSEGRNRGARLEMALPRNASNPARSPV